MGLFILSKCALALRKRPSHSQRPIGSIIARLTSLHPGNGRRQPPAMGGKLEWDFEFPTRDFPGVSQRFNLIYRRKERSEGGS
jgi:hypothetical protein